MKKILGIVGCLLVLLLAFAACSSDDGEDNINGLIVEKQGDKEKIYKVYTAKGLMEFADSMSCLKKQNVDIRITLSLQNDIDMSVLPNNISGGNWRPVKVPTGYYIILEGNNHVVKGLKIRYIEGLKDYGLFENVTARYVTFEDVDIDVNIPKQQETNTGSYYVGTIAGQGNAYNSFLKSGQVCCQTKVSNVYIGGVVGHGVGRDCHSNLDLLVKNESQGDVYVGGFAGNLGKDSYDVTKLSTSGSIKVEGADVYVGGLAGETGEIMLYCSSAASIEVSGGDSYAGGLVGRTFFCELLICCYFNGILTGTLGNVGGLVGTGYPYTPTFISCFADANIMGKRKGGLVGITNKSQVEGYFCGTTMGLPNIGDGGTVYPKDSPNNLSLRSIYEMLTSKEANSCILDYYNEPYPNGRTVEGKNNNDCIWKITDSGKLRLWYQYD